MTAYYFFDKIIWSPAGQYYALPLNTKLMIYNVETAGIACTVESDQKIHGVTFLMVINIILDLFKYYSVKIIHDLCLQENLICFGSEDGSLHCYDIVNKEIIWEMKVGDIRVKCLMKVDNWLVTALSDGHVTVWKLKGSEKPIEASSLFLDCRVTCMACNHSRYL